MDKSVDPPVQIWKLTWGSGIFKSEPFSSTVPALTLDQTSASLPEGAYTTFRTYGHTRCLRFSEQIHRLTDSARLAQKQVYIPPEPFRLVVREILHHSPFPESRVRVTLDLTHEPGNLYVALEALHIPPESSYLSGVRTQTQWMHRENPKAKLTSFIPTASAYREHLEPGINEILMISPEGYILEGLSSNFFACKKGAIYTAEEGVLAGITRQVILDLARREKITLHLDPVSLDDLGPVDECFLTSASRAVLPVSQIDNQVIGSGRPGPITRILQKRFKEWISKEAEEI